MILPIFHLAPAYLQAEESKAKGSNTKIENSIVCNLKEKYYLKELFSIFDTHKFIKQHPFSTVDKVRQQNNSEAIEMEIGAFPNMFLNSEGSTKHYTLYIAYCKCNMIQQLYDLGC